MVDAVRRAYPGLDVEDRGGQVVIAGELVLHDDGVVLDHYLIEIELPRDGPRAGMAVVREVGGRIPRIEDRHVNDLDGTCCLMVTDQFWFEHPQGMDVVDFIDGPVRGFFVSQSHFDVGGGWPYGEYGHGCDGIVQFYRALFGVEQEAVVLDLLRAIGGPRLRGRRVCPCGGGRAARDCHGPVLSDLLERIPPHTLHASIVAVTISAALPERVA